MSKAVIYVLRLKSNRFYVGKSTNIVQRIQEHLLGEGVSWTQKYPPIGIERALQNCTPFDEDKITKEYMAEYGIDNVRGGTYTQDVLSHEERTLIQREIWVAYDRCKRCGHYGHVEADCYAYLDVNGNEIF
jgi:predicted GIY-YIG superfamily endonuclease